MHDSLWPKHLYALDISRAFAALSVVLWHWQHFGYKELTLSGDFQKENQALYEIFKLFYEKGFGGVGYFFLLSGFIFFWLYRESIQNKKISVKIFFVQRFSRLYPLHIAALAIVALLQWLYLYNESVFFVYPFNDTYHFMLNVGFASKWGFENGWSFNAPIWSVSIEVLLYIIFFIAALFRQGGWLFSLVVSIVSFALSHVYSHSLLGGLSLFFLGGVVYQFTFLISTRYKFLKSFVYLIGLGAWLSVIVNFYVYEFSHVILEKIVFEVFQNYILFPFTVSGLALLEIDRGNFLKSISWIGNITYSSYLLHFPLQLLFGLAVSYGVLNHLFYMSAWYLVLYFMILIPLSYMVYLKFERPMQKMIRGRFLK